MRALVADPIDVAALDRALAGTPFAGRLRHFPSLGSTSTLAMQEAEAGAAGYTVYVADEQTAGRGRGAHRWHSAPGAGLYVSVLLRPRIAPADILWLSLAAGLAAREAIRLVTSAAPDIRWPNDILLGGRKLGGILTELNAEVTRVRHAVVGIGINVHQPEFPPELARLATSLRLETGQDWPRQELLAALLISLERELKALTGEGAPDRAARSIRERLEEASTWVRGKAVTVTETDTYSGITDGLDDRGFLRVQTAGGLRIVMSGGVREEGPEHAAGH